MAFVKVQEGERIEDALRRFKRACERDGIQKELKRRRHYVPPSVRRKIKLQEAWRKRRRRSRRPMGAPRPTA